MFGIIFTDGEIALPCIASMLCFNKTTFMVSSLSPQHRLDLSNLTVGIFTQ